MTEPIRKSQLPCTPPPEWEFSTVLGQPSGCLLAPGQYEGFPVVRRRVSYGDWEPVTHDHWAEEPETDAEVGPAPAGTVDNPEVAWPATGKQPPADFAPGPASSPAHRELQQLRVQLGEARTALRITEGDRDAADTELQQLREQVGEARTALAMQQGISADLRVESQARGEKLRRVAGYADAWFMSGTGPTRECGRTILAAIKPQGECRRCHCPAGAPQCDHCNCCDVPDPQEQP